MRCRIRSSVVSEKLVGNIGDDWKYKVKIEYHNPGLARVDELKVDEHQLTPGTTQVPPVSGAVDWSVPGSACGTSLNLRLTLDATEVDWLFDDENSNSILVPVECPGPGGPPFEIEPEISVTVKEAPNLLSNSATLTVKLRITARCSN